MDILFLTQILPYPPDAGPRVKTWHVLRYLAGRGHRIWLASFIRPDEVPHLPKVEKLVDRVIPVPIRRSRISDLAFLSRSQLSGSSFLIERDNQAGMRAAVRQALAERPAAVIHADQLGMAQFALLGRRLQPGRPPAILFDSHNAVWMIVERMAENANPLLQPFLRLEARRIRRYEAGLVRSFDHTMAVTGIDRAAMAGSPADLERITTIPIAVDTEALQPSPVPLNGRPPRILTLGTLGYPPNADGIRWFLNEAYPLVKATVPDADLTIVGKQPPADFLERAAADPSIQVTGYVPDLQPFMDAAAVVVVPVRAGGGMRVRILEACARGMPVVTTTVGLEGIDAAPGRDVLVADTPQDFALAVQAVLENGDLRASLSANGRRLAEERYTWQVVLRQMDAVYERLAAPERER